MYVGKAVIKVSANGCGIGLADALITIKDISSGGSVSAYTENDGFTPVMEVFSSEKRGDRRFFSIEASLDGFTSLTIPFFPIRSGYTFFLSMPLERKSEKEQENSLINQDNRL